jgi:hypothetical protein
MDNDLKINAILLEPTAVIPLANFEGGFESYVPDKDILYAHI